MMPRKPSGSIVETPSGGFALRFRALGKRRYLSLSDGTTREQAAAELAYVLAQVERGEWEPPKAPAPAIEPDEVGEVTFHEFATDWYAAKAGEVRPSTAASYLNELSNHLLPFFHAHVLSEITVDEVDRYREAKVQEGRFAASHINATITRLGTILDVADERGLIERNPVRVNPRNRKLKASKKQRAYLDRPEQIEALLLAAGQLDAEAACRADRDTCVRRPLLATLTFAGLRIAEAVALRWRDVDLAAGRLRIVDSKTDAGVRLVPIVPVLRDVLLERKASLAAPGPDDSVFATTAGTPLRRDNTRTRILAPALRRADELLLAEGLAPLPEGLTQHSLRHTYISLRVALGDDLARIARDAGHADVQVTFRIYTHVLDLDDAARERLRALVDGQAGPSFGQRLGSDPAEAPSEIGGVDSWGGTRTPDLTIMRALGPAEGDGEDRPE